MVNRLVGIKLHGVGVSVTLSDLAAIGIIGHSLVFVGNGVGINTIDIHIDNDLVPGKLRVGLAQILHDIQQLVGPRLADNGTLECTGAGEPRRARAIAVNHQRVMLVLRQSKTVLRSELADLLIKVPQFLPQRGIRLALRNGMDVFGCLGSAVHIEVVLLLAHRTVTDAVLGAADKIALRLSLRVELDRCHLLQNRNCSLADLVVGCRGGDGHHANQQNESQQCAYKSLLHKLLLLFSYVSNGIITDSFTNCNTFLKIITFLLQYFSFYQIRLQYTTETVRILSYFRGIFQNGEKKLVTIFVSAPGRGIDFRFGHCYTQ